MVPLVAVKIQFNSTNPYKYAYFLICLVLTEHLLFISVPACGPPIKNTMPFAETQICKIELGIKWLESEVN